MNQILAYLYQNPETVFTACKYILIGTLVINLVGLIRAAVKVAKQ